MELRGTVYKGFMMVPFHQLVMMDQDVLFIIKTKHFIKGILYGNIPRESFHEPIQFL